MPFVEDSNNTPVTKTPVYVNDPAGGDLAGTYPNPTIGTGSVTTDKIAIGAVGTDEIAAGAIVAPAFGDPLDFGFFPILSGNYISSGLLTSVHLSNHAAILTSQLQEGDLFVKTTGNQTVSGIKIFQKPRTFLVPTDNFDVVNKKYVDTRLISGTTGGAAGGDLTGTYPNPTIRLSAISGNYIYANSILQGHVQSGFVTLFTNQVISGQKVFQYIQCSGNPIFGNDLVNKLYLESRLGSVALTQGSVSGNIIAANSVLQGHIASGYVDLNTNQVASGAKTFQNVFIDKLGVGTKAPSERASFDGNINLSGITIHGGAGSLRGVGVISGNNIAANSLLAGHFSSGVVSGNVIGANAILQGHLANAIISGNIIVANSIAQGHVLSGYVDLQTNQVISGQKVFQYIQCSGNPIFGNDLTNKLYVESRFSTPFSGDLTGNLFNPTIANAAISGNKIAANSILLGHHALSSISGNLIVANSIAQGHVLSGYVDLQTNQVVSGQKVFQYIQCSGNPIFGNDLTNKLYVESRIPTSLPPSGSAGGDLTGTYPNPTIRLSAVSGNIIGANSILQGHIQSGYVDLFTNQVISGQKVFQYAQISGNPIFGNDLVNKLYVESRIGTGSAPTGNAGGDLTGTYPNPTIRLSAVSGNIIAANSILQGHIQSGYVDLFTNQVISGQKVFQYIQVSGNPLFGNDLTNKLYVESRIPTSLPPSGAAGGDLTGTYPNPTIRLSAVSGNYIGANSILQGHIQSGYVDLFTNQVISGQKVFQYAQISGNPIFNNDLTNKIFVTSLVAAGTTPTGTAGGDLAGTYPNPTHRLSSVSGNVIATQSVAQGHVLSGYVDLQTNQVISGQKVFQYIQVSGNPLFGNDLTNKLYVESRIPTSLPPNGNAGGDLTGTYPNPTIRLSAISGNYVYANSIAQGHVLSGYVDLQTNQVISGQKVFQYAQISGNPIFGNDLVNKLYVESRISAGLPPSGAAGGDLAGTYPNPTHRLSSVSGNVIGANSVAQGHVLSGYVDLFTNQVISGQKVFQYAQISGNPIFGNDLTNKLYVESRFSTAFTGDLTGNLFNPTIANAAISGNKIAANSILLGHHVLSSISGNLIVANSILQGHIQSGYVDLFTNQVISGQKVFQYIQVSGNPIFGNDLTNKLYVESRIPTSLPPSGNAGGDLAGTYPNPTIRLSAISGNYVYANSIAQGHVLSGYVDLQTNQVISGQKVFQYAQISGNPIFNNDLTNKIFVTALVAAGTTPTGTAGGDLAGTYPNPTHRLSSVSGNVIGANSITQGHVLSGFVDLFTNQVISGQKVFQYAQISGNPIFGNDLVNKLYVESRVGTATGNAGGDLTGTYPNPTIRQSAVSGNAIGAGAILTGHFGSGAVSGNAIGANAILLGHHANASVSGNVIATQSVAQGHVLSGYVDLQTNQVISGQKVFQYAQISGNPIFGNDLTNKLYVESRIPTSLPPNGTAGGDLAGTYPNPTIRLSAISGNYVYANSILQGHVQSGYVDLFTNQVVSGQKVFQYIQCSGNPIFGNDLTNKLYVESRIPTSLPPNGNAGGDLTGTYPNPTIKLSTISGNYIGANSILLGHHANASVSGNVIATQSIAQGHVLSGYVDLFTNQVISGQKVFQYAQISGNPIFGNDLVNKLYVESRVGTATGNAGGDLAGTYPNPTIRQSAVSGNAIGAGAILTGHLADSAVSGTKLVPSAGKWTTDHATNPEVILKVAGALVGEIQNISTLGISIGDASLDVGINRFTAGTFSVYNNATSTPTFKVNSQGKTLVNNATDDGSAYLNISGVTKFSNVAGIILGVGIISGNNIAANSILNGHIAPNAVSGVVIGNGYILNSHLANSAVSGNSIAANSILQGHVSNGYVDLSTAQTVGGAKTLNSSNSEGQIILTNGNVYNNTPQFANATMALGYGDQVPATYKHYIHTTHRDSTPSDNRIEFFTCDGSSSTVFPTNAIFGLAIENGFVTVNSGGQYKWSADAQPGSTKDTGLARVGAANIKITNGSTGLGNLFVSGVNSAQEIINNNTYSNIISGSILTLGVSGNPVGTLPHSLTSFNKIYSHTQGNAVPTQLPHQFNTVFVARATSGAFTNVNNITQVVVEGQQSRQDTAIQYAVGDIISQNTEIGIDISGTANNIVGITSTQNIARNRLNNNRVINCIGYKQAANLLASGSSIDNNYGVLIDASINSGIIGNDYGLCIRAMNGQVQNNYGIYLEHQLSGNLSAYSIYSVSGNHYFNGSTKTYGEFRHNNLTTNNIGKNKIINGNFNIWQRGTAISGIVTSVYLADRWRIDAINGAADLNRVKVEAYRDNTFISGTGTSIVSGANYALRLRNLNENNFSGNNYVGKPASQLAIVHAIEGTNCIGLTQSPSFTLSFWVLSNVTGTYSFLVYANTDNGAGATNTLYYGVLYTINSQNTWEKKTFTIPFPPNNLAPNRFSYAAYPTQPFLQINFSLGGGNQKCMSDSNKWLYVGSNNIGAASLSGVNWTASNQSYFYLAQVQLEAGSTASDFEHKLINQELHECQRYYAKTYGQSAFAGSTSDVNYIETASVSTGLVVFNWRYPVPMRGTPTVTVYSTGTGASANLRDSSAGADRAVLTRATGENSYTFVNNVNTTTQAEHSAQVIADADF